MSKPDSASGQAIDVWSLDPLPGFRVAADRSVRMVVGVNDKNVRAIVGGERWSHKDHQHQNYQ